MAREASLTFAKELYQLHRVGAMAIYVVVDIAPGWESWKDFVLLPALPLMAP